jgi:hypothetical protein
MTPSNLLAAGIGIFVAEKKLLVCENSEGQLELPGNIVANAEVAKANLTQLLTLWNLLEHPQQTLYLTTVRFISEPKKSVTGLARILRFREAPDIEVPNGQYESLPLLQESEHTTALTKAVSHWLSQTV